MADALLRLQKVTRSYKQGGEDLVVLHGIDLTINQGEMVSIVGPSGSGKSTLMNIIGCLDSPTTGSYLVEGHNTFNMTPDELATLRRDFFGFIFQRYHLLTHLNALENVEVPAIYAGVKKDKRDSRALQLLGMLGLSDRVSHKPSELSGGQQQRVSIARSLMNGGQIILADEPTGALDSKSGVEVMKILKDLNDQGHTIIIVTHDMNVAQSARRIIEISDGRIKSDRPNGTYERQGAMAGQIIKNRWARSITAYVDRFKEAFSMAIRAMVSNRMRTLLTMLGIIIGIMAVVSVVAIGRGASEQVLSNISALGTNTISIYPGQRMGDMRSGRVRTLVPKDLEVLQGQPFVDSASPYVQSTVLLRFANIASDGTAQGVTPELFRVYGYNLAEGRFFTNAEVTNNAQVCVIDYNARKNLFPREDPLGKKILINKMSATVIGVLEKADSPFMRTETLYVFVPYTALMSRLIKQDYLSSIVVRIKDGVSAAVAEASIESLLTTRHGRKDFFLTSSDSIMKSISSTTMTFTLLISAIAVISLIVGGIGVMNIMLVSVTERTKEIGIRMAVGARQSDIMTQFLIEAVMVCLIGGALGVIFSFILSLVVGFMTTAITMSFSPWAIVAAVFTSSAIGVAFGFMPARSAARLNPIDALARE